MTAEPHNATITYPGGLRARWRWAGSGQGPRSSPCRRPADRWSTSGTRVAADPEPLCRAELRLEGPRGAWTARFASAIYDEPRGPLLGRRRACWSWLRVPHVRPGRRAAGDATWDHRSATPIVALFGSSRLAHVVVQSELETFAIEPDGTVAWRVAHSDVVTAAELVGGRLVLTGFDGQVRVDRSGDRARRLSVDGRWITPPIATEFGG